MKHRKEAFRKKMAALEESILRHYALRLKSPHHLLDGSFAMTAWLSGYRAGKRDARDK